MKQSKPPDFRSNHKKVAVGFLEREEKKTETKEKRGYKLIFPADHRLVSDWSAAEAPSPPDELPARGTAL